MSTPTRNFYVKGMNQAIMASTFSHDPDTQTGAAVLDYAGGLISAGSNRLPSGIEKTPERVNRPGKYLWLEHAERTAIYKTEGVRGGYMFLNWFPCCDCARAIVAAGIIELVYLIKEDRWNDPRYNFETSKEILIAGGVKLTPYVEE